MIKKHKRTNSGWMRRTSRIYLNDLNTNKSNTLKEFLNNYQNATNYTIQRFWANHDVSNNLPSKDVTDAIKSRFNTTSRLAQCIGKQSKETVHSQIEFSKRKRRIPRFKSHTANLYYHFVKIEPFDGHFDMCIKTASGVPKMVIPFNWTEHTNKFRNNRWVLSKSIRMGYNENGLFVDLIFEKEKPKLREEGKIIGTDRGYNCMIVSSDGQEIGKELKEKIKKGGKRRKTWHRYIETETNRHLKRLDLSNVREIATENLKYVKSNTKGKFPRKLNRLLSFWLYAKTGVRLKQYCEELGVRISLKNPYKTSQHCPVCGNIDKRNRKGEKFLCLSCGHTDNADHNASKNLELLGLAGVYSLRSLPSSFIGEVNKCL